MIDSFDLWSSFQSTVNTFQGGWFRPQTDFIQKCNDLSKKYWNKYRDESEKSQKAKDNMMPFLIKKNYKVDNMGIRAHFKPDKNYGGFAAARVILYKGSCIPDLDVDGGKVSNVNEFKSEVEKTEEYYDGIVEYDIELIDGIKWGAVNKHRTKGPRLDSPKMRQIDGGFEVAPRAVSVVVLDYYREPKEATFVYTITSPDVETGAGDQIVYDKDKSQPLEWHFNMRDEFLIGLGEAYGVFTRDQFITQINLQKQP